MPSSLPPETAPPPVQTATEALYRAALAEGDIGFYLPVFAGFDERGVSRPRWNPAAALFNLNWLLYRRLWRAAVLHTLCFCALGLALWWSGPALGALGPVLWLCLIGAAVAVPGFWGTAWLHHDVRRRMTAAVRRARTVQEACDALRQQDRRRQVLWGAAVLQLVLVGLIGLDTSWQAAPARPEARPPAPAATAPAPAPTVPEEPLPVPPPAAAPAPVAAPDAGSDAVLRPRWRGHGVNVGMFADAANADRARQRLVDAGLPVVVDPVESARGPLMRVRVGPFDNATDALQAAERVRAVGLEARVFGP